MNIEVIKVDLETKKSYLAKEVFSRGLEAQTNNFDFPLISCLRLYVLRPACLYEGALHCGSITNGGNDEK